MEHLRFRLLNPRQTISSVRKSKQEYDYKIEHTIIIHKNTTVGAGTLLDDMREKCINANSVPNYKGFAVPCTETCVWELHTVLQAHSRRNLPNKTIENNPNGLKTSQECTLRATLGFWNILNTFPFAQRTTPTALPKPPVPAGPGFHPRQKMRSSLKGGAPRLIRKSPLGGNHGESSMWSSSWVVWLESHGLGYFGLLGCCVQKRFAAIC